MENKKIFWINISAAAVTVLISITALIILCFSGKGSCVQTVIPEASSPKAGETVSASEEPEYRLCEVDGVVGVIDRNGNILEKINVPVITLPKSDQERLKRGITVFGDRELEKAKEDFSG